MRNLFDPIELPTVSSQLHRARSDASHILIQSESYTPTAGAFFYSLRVQHTLYERERECVILHSLTLAGIRAAEAHTRLCCHCCFFNRPQAR
jgi:hypothetical protein